MLLRHLVARSVPDSFIDLLIVAADAWGLSGEGGIEGLMQQLWLDIEADLAPRIRAAVAREREVSP